MKTQKTFKNRIFITAAMVILFSVNMFAQQEQKPQRPPPFPDSARIAQMVDELATALSLSDTQKEKIAELHFDHFAEAKVQMELGKDDRENNREKMDALRKDFEEQMQALLTDDQKIKLNEFMKNRGPRQGKPKQKRQ